MASRVSNLETSTWEQRSIVRLNLGNIFESRRLNAIWLVTVERSKSRVTVSFVKLIYRIRAQNKGINNVSFSFHANKASMTI